MRPIMDSGHRLLVTPQFEIPDLRIGDIVVVENTYGFYVHQIMHIGEDGDGWYALTKGTAYDRIDPVKARENDIKSLVLGVLWGIERSDRLMNNALLTNP